MEHVVICEAARAADCVQMRCVMPDGKAEVVQCVPPLTNSCGRSAKICGQERNHRDEM